MYHLGCESYKVWSNDDSRLTLTYFMIRSNLFHGSNQGKLIFQVVFTLYLLYTVKVIRHWL